MVPHKLRCLLFFVSSELSGELRASDPKPLRKPNTEPSHPGVGSLLCTITLLAGLVM